MGSEDMMYQGIQEGHVDDYWEAGNGSKRKRNTATLVEESGSKSCPTKIRQRKIRSIQQRQTFNAKRKEVYSGKKMNAQN